MKCVFTLDDFIFGLCQDEDVLVKVVDYETGEVLIKSCWKSCLLYACDEYQLHKNDEVENVSPCSFPGNIGFEITVKYY